jgi:hypothetical protein
MSSPSDRGRRIGTETRRWRFNDDGLTGVVFEDWNDRGDFFVFWLYDNENEIWEGYSFARIHLGSLVIDPYIGRIVAWGRGIGTESGLWLVVEELGNDDRWWLFYRRRRGGNNYRMVLRIRTGQPEYDSTEAGRLRSLGYN